MTIQSRKSQLACSASAVTISKASFTLITADQPKVLTKQFRLEDGTLVKESGGNLVRGRAELCEAKDLSEFAEVLQRLGADQALAYGVTGRDACNLVTKAEWEQLGRPDDPLPRSKEHFAWRDGPGVLMLDYDPADDGRVLDQETLLETLRAAVPGLTGVELLWWPSASSRIHDRTSGREVQGLRGQRVYIMVKDARDIPRAGQVIYDRLWLAGHGYFKVSKSGALLDRCLVDGQVWQPNRLDFAAGACCAP